MLAVTHTITSAAIGAQVSSVPFAFALANTLLWGTLALYFVHVRLLEGRLPKAGLS